MRRFSIGCGGLIAVLLLALLLFKAVADRAFYDGYDRNLPLDARIADVRHEPSHERQAIYLDTRPGERLPVLLTLPKGVPAPFPCVVFLHGIGQKKEFLDEITLPFNEAGFAVATFDQCTRGERKLPADAGPLAQVKAFRRRASATVIDTRRLIDYLETRHDIAAGRVYLVGASYGAITGSVAAAFDERLKAVALVYGGGNLNKLLSAPMIREGAGAWLLFAKPVMWYLLSASDPVKHAGGISPRPVLLQCGEGDRLVAPPAASALVDAVNEPKEVRWYAGDHIGMDEATVWRVLGDAIGWLEIQDARVRAGNALPGAA